MYCHVKKKLFYGRFETKFWKWKYNSMMVVLLMNAVMGWRHGDKNQRGVSVSVFGSERKRFEEEEEEGSGLKSRGKKKKDLN